MAAVAGAAAGVPLRLSFTPACLTCGLYQGKVVVDPDHGEEALMGARLTVAVDGEGGLLGVYKSGGAAPAPPQTLLTCAALAHARQREVAEQLEAALKAAADAEGGTEGAQAL